MNYCKCICAQLDSGNFIVLCNTNTLVNFNDIKSTKLSLYKLDVITRDIVINFPTDLDDESTFKFIRIHKDELRLIDNEFRWGFGLVDHDFKFNNPKLVAVSELFLPIDQFIESNPSDFNNFVDLDKEKQEYSDPKDSNNSTTINIDDYSLFSKDDVTVDDIKGYVDSSIETLENSISNYIANVKYNVNRIEENNNIITKRIEKSINIITKNIRLLALFLALVGIIVGISIFDVIYINAHIAKDDNTAISSNIAATDTLSKCPICGSEANVYISYNNNKGTEHCSISCSNINCGLSISYQDTEEAFKKWNSLQYNK